MEYSAVITQDTGQQSVDLELGVNDSRDHSGYGASRVQPATVVDRVKVHVCEQAGRR